MRHVAVAAVFMALIAVPHPPAGATTIRAMSLTEMTLASDAIVHGVVIDEIVQWDGERGRIYTTSALRVTEAWAGRAAPGDVILVRQLGGALDGIEQRVVGTATLELGSEVVVFTRTDGAFHYLVGMSQGRYGVSATAGAPPTLSRRVTGVTRLLPRQAERPPAADRLTYERARAEVRRIRATRGVR